MTTAYGRHADDDTAELFPPQPQELGLAQQDGVDLDSDPFADDLTEQLAEKAPRQYVTRATVILGGLVLLVAGFLAGAQVQKNWGTSSTQGTGQFGNFPRTGASGFPGGLGGYGGQQGGTGTGTGGTGTGTGGGTTTTGTVKLVDGSTVYIQTANGTTVTIKTGGSTSVNVSQSGSLSDLKAGATVAIQGQTGSDGAVTATQITRTK